MGKSMKSAPSAVEVPPDLKPETIEMIANIRDNLKTIRIRREGITESIQGLKSSIRVIRKDSEALIKEQNRTHAMMKQRQS